jgi:hypothetical protein
MLQVDVALVLLDPGLDGMAGLTNTDLATLGGHAVNVRSLGPTYLRLCLDGCLLMWLKVVLT